MNRLHRYMSRVARLGVCLLAPAILAEPVHAALGDLEGDVGAASGTQATRIALNAVRPGLVAHQLKDQRGVAVRQYAASGGKVFAVTWQGPFKPDMRQLLGRHFDAYVQGAAAGGAPTRGRVIVERPEVVIQSFGHMRSFSGRAWIPDQVPAGVAPEQLQ